MIKRVAVVGDPTTTGGQIITGEESMLSGTQVAVFGSLTTCPKCNKTGKITEGEPSLVINGKPAALDGYIISCNCPFGQNKIIAINSSIYATDSSESVNEESDSVINNMNKLFNFVDDGIIFRMLSAFDRNNNPICSVEKLRNFNYPKWNNYDYIKWKLPFLGGEEHLERYKDGFIVFHKDYIINTAKNYNIPVKLLAGIARAEAGGMPDYVKTDGVLQVRKFVPFFTKKPEATSIGIVSMQIRVAAKTLGLDDSKLTNEELNEFAICLYQDKFNLDVVARHLSDLIQYDYPEIPLSERDKLTDEQIIVIGSRYNRGIERKLQDFIDSINAPIGDPIREYSEYGRSIIRHNNHVNKLLDLEE